MIKLALVAINSSYQHPSFGLRYLYAQLGEYKKVSEILEFTIKKPIDEIAESILSKNPEIVGIGVYIWNITESIEVCRALKARNPKIKIVVGGPEVSHEIEGQEILNFVDLVIQGEADLEFKSFIENYFVSGFWPPQKILKSSPPDVKALELPYSLYNSEDIKNRFIYVEASRGCPYLCEYCLSSLDKGVRSFEIEKILSEIEDLVKKGAKNFKFVDRTFNLNPTTCLTILNFFLKFDDPLLVVHFEMVPDRLPEEIKLLLPKFKPGQIQFEIGIQTFNPEVAKNVSRKNDLVKVKANFDYLKSSTGIHTHADLIAGLPGESLASFANGFDQLWEMQPNEIQVGILKRLKGAPIRRHEKTFELVFQKASPYQIQSTKDLSAEELTQIGHFAKYWDLINNQGRFLVWMKALRIELKSKESSSFWFFWNLSIHLWTFLNKDYSVTPWELKDEIISFCKLQGLTSQETLLTLDFQKSFKSRQERHWESHV